MNGAVPTLSRRKRQRLKRARLELAARPLQIRPGQDEAFMLEGSIGTLEGARTLLQAVPAHGADAEGEDEADTRQVVADTRVDATVEGNCSLDSGTESGEDQDWPAGEDAPPSDRDTLTAPMRSSALAWSVAGLISVHWTAASVPEIPARPDC